MKETPADTGEHIISFDRAAMDKAVDKPSNATSIDIDTLRADLDNQFNMITELQRNMNALIDRVEWIRGQGKVGTVWVIEKDKKTND